jgi:hypothetical protein
VSFQFDPSSHLSPINLKNYQQMSVSDFQPVLQRIIKYCQQYHLHHHAINGQKDLTSATQTDLPILADLQTTIRVLADESASVPACSPR